MPTSSAATREALLKDLRDLTEEDPLEVEASSDGLRGRRSPMTLSVAFAPYVFLAIIAVVALAVLDERRRPHDDAGNAEAALDGAGLDERLLYRIELPVDA